MGTHQKRSMTTARTLLLFGAVVAACHALPASFSSEEVKHLREQVTYAQDELKDMVDQQVNENTIMGMLKSDAEDAEKNPSKLLKDAEDMKAIETEGIAAEDQQQSLAVNAKNEIENAISDMYTSQSETSLGEGDTTEKTAVELAMDKLQKVENKLQKDTQTMRTQDRIKRMKDETNDLIRMESGSKTTLGEALTPEQQKIQDTAIAKIQEIQNNAKEAISAAGNTPSQSSTAATTDYTPKPGEGANSLLSHTTDSNHDHSSAAGTDYTPRPGEGVNSLLSHTVDSSTAASNVQAEKKELDKLLKQEETVHHTEKVAQEQIGELIKQLN